MTLATDLYLRLSEEDSFVSALPRVLGQITTAFGGVVARLIEESPSLAKFFPVDLVSKDLSVEPVIFSIGGYHLSIEFVGLLNKPVIVEVEGEEVENRLNAVVDFSVIRDGSDMPFVATLGLGKVDGVWEEYVPTIDGIDSYEVVDSLELWIESFLRAALIEHRFVPGAFDVDSELYVEDLDLVDGDITVDVI